MSTRKKRGAQAVRDEAANSSSSASPLTASDLSSGELHTRPPMRGHKGRKGKGVSSPDAYDIPAMCCADACGSAAHVEDGEILEDGEIMEVATPDAADRALVVPAPAPVVPAPVVPTAAAAPVVDCAPVVPATAADLAAEGAAFHDDGVLDGERPCRGPLAAVGAFLRTFLETIFDIVKWTVFILKYPAIFFTTVYILLALTGHVVDAVTECLAPICAVFPGFYACRVTAAADALTATFGNLGRKAHEYERIDFPALMAVQSRTLDQLLAHSAAGSQLALGVKHAELAVKDLTIVIKASNLTSKDILGRSLEEFAQQAKGAARDLQQLSAKLYGAVDTVLAFDEYALHAIAATRRSEDEARHTATQMFRSTMTVLSSEVARVIIESTTVASRLDKLEEKLSIIRAVSEQEKLLTEAALGEVLSELWTVVGGNKAKLRHLGQQIDILRNVDWYRTLSVAHVVATTETLLQIEAELGELRNKLSAPELAGDTIPIGVHIASIERSARRLDEVKVRARAEFTQQEMVQIDDDINVGFPSMFALVP